MIMWIVDIKKPTRHLDANYGGREYTFEAVIIGQVGTSGSREVRGKGWTWSL